MEEIAARREQIRKITASKTDGEARSADTELPVEKPKDEAPAEAIFVGFARVFSGTLKEGNELFVLGPKHKPEVALLKELMREGCSELPPHVTRVTVGALFTMMGRELEKIDSAPAGNIVGNLVVAETFTTALE